MNTFKQLLLLCASFCLSQGAISPAIAAPEQANGTLSGDWGGARGLVSGEAARLREARQAPPSGNGEVENNAGGGARSRMRERGADLEIVLKADVLSNVSGGLRRGTRYLDNWDVKLKLEGEKLWGWQDSQAFFHFISSHGAKFNATNVNSTLGVDNIEVATNTSKIFQAWLQQNFFEHKLSLLLGLYPLDSEFYVTESSGVFLHPSFGMAAEVAQTGVNGPSIFPTSGVGVRALLRPHPAIYWQTAVVDGVPGNPNNPHGTHIRFDRGDGALVITEFGFRPGEAGHLGEQSHPGKGVLMTDAEERHVEVSPIAKYAIGYWFYTAKFNDLMDTDVAGNPLRRANRGAYLLAEKTLFQESADPAQGLAAFIRYGVASGDVNTIDRTLSFGLNYRGLLPGRDQDTFGIAAELARSGGKYRQFQLAAGTPAYTHEKHLEITYRIQAKPWLAVQPSVQRIINPGFDPALANAWIVATRFEVTF